jgi:hypothetical protein
LDSTIPKPTFRPTHQELLRPLTRSWSIPGVCHALPVAPGGLQTMPMGIATLYNGPGTKQSLIVTIPPADPNNKKTPIGSPKGVIANGSTTDFVLAAGAPGAGGPAQEAQAAGAGSTAGAASDPAQPRVGDGFHHRWPGDRTDGSHPQRGRCLHA